MKSRKEILDSYTDEEKMKVLKMVENNCRSNDLEFLEHLDYSTAMIYGDDDLLYLEECTNLEKIAYVNYEDVPEEIDVKEVIFDLSRKITHYIFRNGPIENMHAGKYGFENYEEIPKGTPIKEISQLTDSDMEVLNKYMMDRVGYILSLFMDGEYTKLSRVLSKYNLYGRRWDAPDIWKIENDINESILVDYKGRQNYE